ncbi:hypothetical protein [Sphingomonas sp. M1-B02]|uniref:hypothetical protein n=1 Tax=Sphingomonas sp. M1-B02 TaxID=3114300 RepID=UPI00224070E7|nr:hypothetical protein [Sphingomonas sp. S6-11]UZK65467.1 hypothetical protein OKW87_13250 [Sphingomonas sp. S6-11]
MAIALSFLSTPASAQLLGGKREAKPIAFDARAADAARLTKASKLEVLRGIRSVVIPQFTVEFVDRSTGLSMRQRDGAVAVNYAIAGLEDVAAQALVDQLYAAWTAGLQSQGITVIGPDAAAAMASWNRGIAGLAKATPAMVDTPMGRNRIFGARATPYYFLEGERAAAQSGAARTASGLGGLVPFGGMARGFMGMGKAMKAGGAQLGEMRLGQEANAAVMHVRLVIGIRETDKPSRLFAALRSGDAFIGDPRFAIEAGGSSVDVTSYAGKGGRADIRIPADLLFAQDLLSERLAMANSGTASASNIAARGLFLAGAVSSSFGGGGGINLKQSHNVAATPDKAAYAAAAEENLKAVQAMFLQRLAGAW